MPDFRDKTVSELFRAARDRQAESEVVLRERVLRRIVAPLLRDGPLQVVAEQIADRVVDAALKVTEFEFRSEASTRKYFIRSAAREIERQKAKHRGDDPTCDAAREAISRELDPGEAAIANEARQILTTELRAWPEKDRSIFVARFRGGLTLVQLSAGYAVPKATVHDLLGRLICSLRERLEHRYPDYPLTQILRTIEDLPNDWQ